MNTKSLTVVAQIKAKPGKEDAADIPDEKRRSILEDLDAFGSLLVGLERNTTNRRSL